ncbi:hypothetical protein LTR53_004840 [Teratosphaeriaceae sp. CCFEE 6253]|nr:hypothetical protein LTR53_004840 [Teratosphaeriaceae sp. CCFEE 6253]
MPPRPFPFALNIGTDIVHADRIRRIITKGNNGLSSPSRLERFLNRLLSWREQQLFWKHHGTLENVQGESLKKATEYLAGRWAAKEAAIKAVRYRRLSFLDVQILPSRPDLKTGPIYALILDKPASSGPNSSGHDEERVRVDPNGSHGGAKNVASEPSTRTLDPVSNAERRHQLPTDASTHAPVSDNDPSGQVAKISISHDGEYVTAVCLAAEEPRTGDVGGEAAAREP